MNIDALKKELKSFSKQKLIEEYKDLYLAHDMLKQTSIALNKQLDQANERLGKLEDILEKYGLEVEELDATLKMKTNSIKSFEKLEQDRDTWKRACELACEKEDDCYVYDNIHRAYEFYQQAKAEGNDE